MDDGGSDGLRVYCILASHNPALIHAYVGVGLLDDSSGPMEGVRA
jgi:hypothetical protein